MLFFIFKVITRHWQVPDWHARLFTHWAVELHACPNTNKHVSNFKSHAWLAEHWDVNLHDVAWQWVVNNINNKQLTMCKLVIESIFLFKIKQVIK